jgi:hypothetical protein
MKRIRSYSPPKSRVKPKMVLSALSPLMDIPEIWMIIFTYLPTRILIANCLITHAWLRLIKTLIRDSRTYIDSASDGNVSVRILQYLIDWMPKLRMISLRESKKARFFIHKGIFPYMEHLKYLAIPGKYIQFVYDKVPLLEHLRVSGEFNTNYLDSCQHLKTLCINSIEVKDIAKDYYKFPPFLEEITLVFNNIEVYCLGDALRAMKPLIHLRRLVLYNKTKFCGTCLGDYANLTQLDSLSLINFEADNISIFLRGLVPLTHIKYVIIEGISLRSYVVQDDFDFIMPRMTDLIQLVLSRSLIDPHYNVEESIYVRTHKLILTND